ERLGAELRKMFSANLVKALQLLKEYAVLPVLFTHFRYADIKEKLAQLDTSNYLLKPQAAVKSSLCQEQKKQHKLLKPYFLLLSIIVAQSDLPQKSLKALSFIEDLKQLKFTKAEVQSLNTLYQLLCLLMHFPLKEFLNNTPLQKDFTQWLGSSTADAICSVDDSKTGDAKIIDKFKITNSSLNDPRWNGHYQLANLMDMAKQDKAVNECIKFFLCKNSVFSLEVIERFKVYVQIVDFLEEKPLVVKWPNTGAEHIAPHNRSKLLNLVYAYKMLPLLKTVLVEPV
ncbi:MAG: hypothetical protein HAW63_04405, partial [Bdellovibrionaceae bacterium]|nr:hypothetical protein [Pseudobdellovibrionaceae bacterium]